MIPLCHHHDHLTHTTPTTHGTTKHYQCCHCGRVREERHLPRRGAQWDTQKKPDTCGPHHPSIIQTGWISNG